MKILVLTDHLTHTPSESFYTIVNGLQQSSQCDVLYVASRGEAENSQFFKDASGVLYVCCPDGSISYSSGGTWLKDNISVVDFSDIDIIFLRIDRPVSDRFLQSLSSRFFNKIVINDPVGVILTGSKEFLLQFPDLVPGVALVSSIEDVFSRLLDGPVVLKPFRGFGGKGIIRVGAEHIYFGHEKVVFEEGKSRLHRILVEQGPMVSMDYLREVAQGDKRIVVFNGCILGAVLRVPKSETWLANASMGASLAKAEVMPEEEEIVRVVDPVLKKHGVVLYGIDTLMGDDGKRVLSEINTLNVGGISQMETYSETDIGEAFVREFWKFVEGDPVQ